MIRVLVKYTNGKERILESLWDADIRLQLYLEGDHVQDWEYLKDEVSQ